jgi:hypothetical protein
VLAAKLVAVAFRAGASHAEELFFEKNSKK